ARCRTQPSSASFGGRMTRQTNARVAGVAFLLYIALGISSMVVSAGTSRGEGVAAKLASIAQHVNDERLSSVLVLFSSFMALVLGVTLYALTRDQDPDVAMLGLAFRVGEGIAGAVSLQRSLGLLWLATASGASAPDPATRQALGTFFLEAQGGGVGSIPFAVGSGCFCWLLLRGRLIPLPLARLG